MIDWGEIIEICSDLNDPQIKRAKGVLKYQYKGVPAGKVDSITDADDLAALLLSHFRKAELKNVIFDILKYIKNENLIEKFKDILSDPSQKVNGGTTSSTTESAASSNTLEPVFPADTHQRPKLMRAQQQALVNGGTTSSKTEVSATSSNTGVIVSAADKHPVRAVHVCVGCGNKANYGITSSTTGSSATSSNTSETITIPYSCVECRLKVWDQFHLLFTEIVEELTIPEVKKVKTMLRGREIYKPEASAFEVFLDLEKKGYISPTDQTLLIELLRGIERDDLVLLVKEYQDKYCIPQSQRLLEKTQSKKNLHQISNVVQQNCV